MSALAVTANAIAQTGQISQADIASLRAAIFSDGVVTRQEAESLFAIERARKSHNDAWSELFVEALTDYALHQEQPRDYLSQDTANWIMAQIEVRQQPSMDADVSLVAELIEKSREVPPAFSAFALRLTKDAVVYGDGADEHGRMHKSGVVDAADIALLQRILWGAGSEGQLAVSRQEAEALFSIADATTGAGNIPEFDDLFAKAVGNYLIGATGRQVPARQEAFEGSKHGDYHVSVIAVLLGMMTMLRPTSEEVREGCRFESLTEQVTRAVEAQHRANSEARDQAREIAEVLTGDKAGWLREHIGKNGVVSAPEKALVRFLNRETSSVDPSLKDLFNKVA